MPRDIDTITADMTRTIAAIAKNGLDCGRTKALARLPGFWPFKKGEGVVYTNKGRDWVTQVISCEWVPGFNQWNVEMENRERGEGTLCLPAKYLTAISDYMREKNLTTAH